MYETYSVPQKKKWFSHFQEIEEEGRADTSFASDVGDEESSLEEESTDNTKMIT